MRNHPLVLHFIALVEGWNAAGWGEYLLWETIAGQRDRPFPLLEPLSKTDRDVCCRLRDELQVWAYWDPTGNEWEVVSIKAWRHHVKNTSASDVRDALENKS